MDLKRLVKSRGFNVIATLLVLGMIVWGVRNAAPRGGQPLAQATTAADGGKAAAAAGPSSGVARSPAEPGTIKAGEGEPARQAATEPAKTEPVKTEPAKTEATTSQPAAAEALQTDAAKAGAAKAGSAEPPSATSDASNSDAPKSDTASSGPAKANEAAGGMFQDTRPVTWQGEPTAASTPGSAPGAVAAGPGLTFRDDRPLVTDGEPAGGGRDARPSFSDPRPLAAPSFHDPRPIAVPSFADTRPVAATAASPDAIPDARDAAAAARSSHAAPPPVPTQPPPVEVGEKIVVTAGPQPGATAAAGGGSTLVAVAPGPALRVDAGACAEPEVTTEPMDGGMMRIRVAAACRKNEAVQISYGGAELIRNLDAWGSLDLALDCFAGASSVVELRFADGSRKTLAVTANDLDKVSKVAVIWRAPVNLDLHVFEYGAGFDKPGHVWAKAPGAQGAARLKAQAERKGHGYLSSTDGEKSLGDKIEVYTFFHNDEQATGSIALALDYETRGETPSAATCGRGALAEVDFQVVILPRKGQATRQSGVLTRVDCGTKISQEARYNQSALPGLRIRK